MSIKFAILALLAEKPRHGYEIKNEFDRRTNHTWPLNIGQVYAVKLLPVIVLLFHCPRMPIWMT